MKKEKIINSIRTLKKITETNNEYCKVVMKRDDLKDIISCLICLNDIMTRQERGQQINVAYMGKIS